MHNYKIESSIQWPKGREASTKFLKHKKKGRNEPRKENPLVQKRQRIKRLVKVLINLYLLMNTLTFFDGVACVGSKNANDGKET